MNRALRAVVFLLAAAMPSLANAAQTDLQRAELKGPVQKVVTEFIGKVHGKYEDVDRHIADTATYDAAGDLLEDQQYSVDFIKKKKPERKSADTTVFHSVMGDSTEQYKFDANGNIVERATRFGIKFDGPPNDVHRYKYDARGWMIEDAFFAPDGKVASVSFYTRDAKGNISSAEEAMGDAKQPLPHTDYSYVFDSHGNWIKRSQTRKNFPADAYFYGADGTLVRTITYFGKPATGH